MKTFKETQQQKILRLLQEAGQQGVNSHDLTYIHSIKQAPTRIHELEKMGYLISTLTGFRNRSVQYVLEYVPEALRKPIRYDFKDGVATPIYE